jgi:hypothetical protein
MQLQEKFMAFILEHAKRLFPEPPEHEEPRAEGFTQQVKTFVLRRAKRLLPERSEHDEPWSERLARLMIWALLGIAGLVAVVLLVVLAKILVWLSAELAPWFGYISYLCWAIVIAILTPLAFVRRTKPYARLGLMIAAGIFGTILWLGSIEVLYVAWGTSAVFVGLCLLGIGVVPLALLAALFTFDGSGLLVLLVLLASTAGIAFAFRRMEIKSAVTRARSAEIANQTELG